MRNYQLVCLLTEEEITMAFTLNRRDVSSQWQHSVVELTIHFKRVVLATTKASAVRIWSLFLIMGENKAKYRRSR
jgi:hypothetical protein